MLSVEPVFSLSVYLLCLGPEHVWLGLRDSSLRLDHTCGERELWAGSRKERERERKNQKSSGGQRFGYLNVNLQRSCWSFSPEREPDLHRTLENPRPTLCIFAFACCGSLGLNGSLWFCIWNELFHIWEGLIWSDRGVTIPHAVIISLRFIMSHIIPSLWV